MNTQFKRIVLADDDQEGNELFQIALNECCPNHKLLIVKDGNKLISLIDDLPTPYIILLTLNIPGKSGKKCLEEIRSRKQLDKVSVIILSNAYLENEVRECLSKGANKYMVKPNSFKSLKLLAQNICNGNLLNAD